MRRSLDVLDLDRRHPTGKRTERCGPFARALWTYTAYLDIGAELEIGGVFHRHLDQYSSEQL